MEPPAALAFARTTRQSVLTTIRGNGRPQLSNVLHHVFDDGVIRISITADRAKYRNLAREPWAALHVARDDFFAYVVLEGEVELAPVATRPDDPTVDELVELYRALMGEHESRRSTSAVLDDGRIEELSSGRDRGAGVRVISWGDYRQAMVTERRTVVRFTPNRAYGMLELPPRSGS